MVAATLLFAALLAGYAVLDPPYRAPDEQLHVDLVARLQHDATSANWYREYGTAKESLAVARSLGPAGIYRQGPHLTAAQGRRAQHPSLRELAGAREPSPFVNQLTQHPPLYYALTAALTAGGRAWPYDRFLAALRAWDILLLVGVPALAYATARRLGLAVPAQLTALVLPLAIPQLAHIGSSVNNDNLLTLLGAAVIYLGVRIATGDTSTRTAVLAGAAAGLALLTKGLALVFPPWLALAYLVPSVNRRDLRRSVGSLVAAEAIAVGTGGWWWVRNLVVVGTVQPTIALDAPRRRPGTHLHLLSWLSQFARWMVVRFWSWITGAPGSLPTTVTAVITAAAVVAVVLALWRNDPARRTVLALLLVPAAGITGIVLVGALRPYLHSGVIQSSSSNTQGRYLFPAVSALAVVVAAGATEWSRARRWMPGGVLAVALVLQGTAALRVSRVFWGAPGASLVTRARALAAWAPVPVAVLWVLALAIPFLAAVAFWALLRVGSDPTADLA